jgi:predicted alpha/beta-hydrolase family hydrolase
MTRLWQNREKGETVWMRKTSAISPSQWTAIGSPAPGFTGPPRVGATLVLAHGAGAGHLSGFMTAFARALSERGIDLVTFNFLYMEARKRVPDSNALLEATWRSAIAAAREAPGTSGNRLVIGGKSMGGRIASQVAAQPHTLPARVDGLVFLGYPLHPPGQPGRRRDAHLRSIEVPMLFVQGERDAFGTADEMRPLVALLPRASLCVVAGANHSLEVPKRAVPAQAEVLAAIQDHAVEWIRGLA